MVRAVQAAVFGTADPGWDRVNIEGEGVLPRLREAAAMPPWTAPYRLVVATVSELGPAPATWANALREAPASSRIVLVVDQDKPAGLPVLLNTLERTPSAGTVVIDCTPLKPAEAERWAQETAAEAGHRLAQAAARLLVHKVGTNAGLIRQEVAKLAAYAGRRASITFEDVQAVAVQTAEESVFALMDALGEQNTNRALAVLRQVLAQGENPLGLIALMARHVRQIWTARGSTGPAALAQELRLPGFVAEKLLAQARRLDYDELGRMLCRLADADEAIKTGRISGDVALEMVVMGIELSGDTGSVTW